MIPIEEKRKIKIFDQDEIDRFKIIKRISKESLSTIFHVADKETNKNYVLKIIKPADPDYDYDYDQEYDANLSLSVDEIRSLIKESEIISQLNHPLVTQIVGICFNYEFNEQTMGVVVLEYCQNGSIKNYIQNEKSDNFIELNDTKKLICIYGIASVMKYLHSLRIVHGCIKPSNILLDEFFHPKINDFSSKNIDFDDQSVAYLAPEVIGKNVISQKADVYSFGITVHEILTGKKPNLFKEIELSENLSNFFRILISHCLAFDPNQRPNFSEIVKLFRSDKSFITDSINEKEFSQFCEFVDDFPQKEESIFKVRVNPIDLKLFKIGDLVNKGVFSNIYKVTNINTSEIFSAKINNKDLDSCSAVRIRNLSREIDILSKLNSKSILKFVGYCEKDFQNERRPTIITEFANKCSLDQIINNERNGTFDSFLTDTKKLIIMFGIAFGMSYLHSLNILHRDLKPSSIFLDESLFPKIGNFEFSKEIDEDSDESDFAGTPAYMSPEHLTKIVNHKPSDVYSFSLIVYELMTLQVPFKGFDRIDVLMKISEGYRPKIPSNLPDCYCELIEDCWLEDPSKRPTFDEIVHRLKTNQNFITRTVDKDEFLRYIDYLNENSKQENDEKRSLENTKKNNEECNNNEKCNNKEESNNNEECNNNKNKIESDISFISEKINNDNKDEKIEKIENFESEKTFQSDKINFESEHFVSEKNEIKETVTKMNKKRTDISVTDKVFTLPHSSLETESFITKLDSENDNYDDIDNYNEETDSYYEKTENKVPDNNFDLPQSKLETDGVITKLEIDVSDDDYENDATIKSSLMESEGITIKLCIDDDYDDETENVISRKRKLRRKKVRKSVSNQDSLKKSKRTHKLKKRRQEKKSIIKIFIKSDDESDIPISKPKYESPNKSLNKSPNKTLYKSPNKLLNKSPNKHQGNSPSKLQDKPPNKSLYKSPNKPQDNSPNKLQDKSPNKPQDKSPNKILDKSPSKLQDNSPNKSFDKSPNKPQDKSPSKLQDNSPNKPQDKSPNKSPSKLQDKSPNKPQDKSPSKLQDNSPNKPQDKSPNKPQDNSPNKSFDKSPNKPKDNSPSKLQDNSPNKSFDKSPNNLQDNSPNKSFYKSTNNVLNRSQNKPLEKQQELRSPLKFAQTVVKTTVPKIAEQTPKPSQSSSGSPKKPFVSHYDPSVFYPRFYPSKTPQMPTHDTAYDPIKLTVTLKDIGLEGLDSKIPDKAQEIRTREKIEKEITYSCRSKFQQTSLSQYGTNSTESNSESDLNNSSYGKSTSLLLSSEKAQKSKAIIPKSSPRRNIKQNRSGSNF